MSNHTKHHPGRHRRNLASDGIPDDVLLPLAPIQPSFFSPQATQPAFAFQPLQPALNRPTSRPRRIVRTVGRKTAEAAAAAITAIKPEAATITKDHVLGVGANAAGGIVTAIAANELVDNLGVMPMAIGAAFVGGLGSVFLKGHWQKACQGMLGAGVGQLGVAYLTERGLKKAAKASAAATTLASALPAAAAAGKRNAYLGGEDDDTMIRAMERTERRINSLLADEDPRNAYGDGGIDADAFDVYGYAA